MPPGQISGGSDYDSLAHLAYAGLQADGTYISLFFLSHLYLGLGDRETALDLIETAYAERDGNLIWNFSDPILNELREEPRFKELKQKLNI